jgi:hypothetical protein
VFDRRIDARNYLTTIENSKITGNYVDPEPVQDQDGLIGGVKLRVI